MVHERATWVAVVLIALFSSELGAQEPSKPGQGGKYALLVGVRQYRPNTLLNLQFTEADVNKLAEVLEHSGYRRQDITILTQALGSVDADLLPTAENIRSQLGIPARPGSPFRRGLKLGPLDEDDSLLVAFAGHGIQFDANGDSFFCPMDANPDDESTLIPLADVSRALDGCKAGFKLLLVDACRNNPRIDAGRNGNRPVVDLPSLSRPFLKPKPGGTMAMFSCSPGEIAFEDDAAGVQHGIFFHHVIRAFEGDPGLNGKVADLDGDGRIDALELASYAERNVAAHAAKRFRIEQTVEVANRTRGSIALVERRVLAKSLTNSIGMKLNLIPAGEFLMGARDDEAEAEDDEKPRHRVRITRPFYLGAYEVTQAEYRSEMGSNPSYFSAGGEGKAQVVGMDTSRHPVERVTWNDAIAFCNKLSDREGIRPYYQFGAGARSGGDGYRLPTEAEWEYACRAGTSTVFAFGDKLAPSQANFELKRTTPVGSYRPNPFGLFDMHGNVWEWCADFYDAKYYEQSTLDNPSGPSQAERRVIRSGGWGVNPRYGRSADRGRGTLGSRFNNIGFRVARDPSRPQARD